MDAQYPRLDAVAAALVGTPDSGMALRELQRDYRGARGPREVPEVRLDNPGAGPGCLGHVVQLGALAFCDAGLAGEYAGFPNVLPDQFADHRLRDSLFLGSAHGHDGNP